MDGGKGNRGESVWNGECMRGCNEAHKERRPLAVQCQGSEAVFSTTLVAIWKRMMAVCLPLVVIPRGTELG